MEWVPASYGGNCRRGRWFVLSLVVRSLRDYLDSWAPASETINDLRFLTRLRLRSLKVYDHDRLEGLSFSVTEVRPIAPLLYSLDGGGGQSSVSFDQS
jgi:hypothetical protein